MTDQEFHELIKNGVVYKDKDGNIVPPENVHLIIDNGEIIGYCVIDN